MREDRRGNTGISTPYRLTTRRATVFVGYIVAKVASFYTSCVILGGLKHVLYPDLEISALLPHFSGSVQGLRALEAGREVLRLNQLCVRISGDDAGIFKFVDVSTARMSTKQRFSAGRQMPWHTRPTCLSLSIL